MTERSDHFTAGSQRDGVDVERSAALNAVTVPRESLQIEARLEASRAASPSARIVEIGRTKGWRSIDLRELWAYRDLLYILVWRDLKVRYRQTLLGALWVIGQPFVTMLIFTFLFNHVAKIQAAPGIPYPVFVISGLLPWNFFATSVQNSSNSLVGASHLISKVYFPRLLVPAAAVLASLVDLMVACGLLGAMMLWYRSPVLPTLLLLPAVVLLACGLAAGVGLWLSALNVEYRDVRVVIPFVLQLWMYATPVVYPLSVLPPAFEAVALLNPMTGVVEAFRGCLFGLVPAWRVLGIALLATLVLLSSGALYFRRTERTFADML